MGSTINSTSNVEIRLINQNILEKSFGTNKNIFLFDDPFNVYNSDIVSHLRIEKIKEKQRQSVPVFSLSVDGSVVNDLKNDFDVLWETCSKYQEIFMSGCKNEINEFGNGNLFSKWSALKL